MRMFFAPRIFLKSCDLQVLKKTAAVGFVHSFLPIFLFDKGYSFVFCCFFDPEQYSEPYTAAFAWARVRRGFRRIRAGL